MVTARWWLFFLMCVLVVMTVRANSGAAVTELNLSLQCSQLNGYSRSRVLASSSSIGTFGVKLPLDAHDPSIRPSFFGVRLLAAKLPLEPITATGPALWSPGRQLMQRSETARAARECQGHAKRVEDIKTKDRMFSMRTDLRVLAEARPLDEATAASQAFRSVEVGGDMLNLTVGNGTSCSGCVVEVNSDVSTTAAGGVVVVGSGEGRASTSGAVVVRSLKAGTAGTSGCLGFSPTTASSGNSTGGRGGILSIGEGMSGTGGTLYLASGGVSSLFTHEGLFLGERDAFWTTSGSLVRLIVGGGTNGAGSIVRVDIAINMAGCIVVIGSGEDGASTSGAVFVRFLNAGTAGTSGRLVFSSGTASSGNSGAVLIGTGASTGGRGGMLTLTVGNGTGGTGGIMVRVDAGISTTATGGIVVIECEYCWPSGRLVFSSGTASSGSSDAVLIGTGASPGGRGGMLGLTVGSRTSGTGAVVRVNPGINATTTGAVFFQSINADTVGTSGPSVFSFGTASSGNNSTCEDMLRVACGYGITCGPCYPTSTAITLTAIPATIAPSLEEAALDGSVAPIGAPLPAWVWCFGGLLVLLVLGLGGTLYVYAAKNKELEAEKKKLTAENKELEAENEPLRLYIRRILGRALEREKKADVMREKLQKKDAAAAAMNVEICELHAMVQEKDDAAAVMNVEIGGLHKRLHETSFLIRQGVKAQGHLAEHLDTQKEKVARLEEEKRNLEKQVQEKSALINETVDYCDFALNRLQPENAKMKGQLQDKEAQLQEKEEKVAALTLEVNKLNVKKTKLYDLKVSLSMKLHRSHLRVGE